MQRASSSAFATAWTETSLPRSRRPASATSWPSPAGTSRSSRLRSVRWRAVSGADVGRSSRSSRSSPTWLSPGRPRRSSGRRLMAGVVLLARETGRAGRAAAALGWAATLLLITDPSLISDAGFQLSSLATAGLIAWATPLTAWIESIGRGRLPRWLAESLGVSLAAQAATLPIILVSFGRLAILSPIVNLLVVPLVAPAMAAGILALAGGLAARRRRTVGPGGRRGCTRLGDPADPRAHRPDDGWTPVRQHDVDLPVRRHGGGPRHVRSRGGHLVASPAASRGSRGRPRRPCCATIQREARSDRHQPGHRSSRAPCCDGGSDRRRGSRRQRRRRPPELVPSRFDPRCRTGRRDPRRGIPGRPVAHRRRSRSRSAARRRSTSASRRGIDGSMR